MAPNLRGKHRHRPTPPPDPIQQNYEKIRRSLSRQGYRLRRSPNDAHAWRITGSFPGFYLLRALTADKWNLHPNDGDPSRETLNQLIQEALDDAKT
ncbi:MAG: hypothetical protein ONB55_22545 [candidate division KSB1 bacterium]|nr:hypothetical protein [candidate division KSB1 bacterium]